MENKQYLKLTHCGFTSTIALETIDFEQDIFQLSLKSDLDSLRRSKNLKSLCEKYDVIINSKGESIIMTNGDDLKKNAKKLAKFAFKLNSFK